MDGLLPSHLLKTVLKHASTIATRKRTLRIWTILQDGFKCSSWIAGTLISEEHDWEQYRGFIRGQTEKPFLKLDLYKGGFLFEGSQTAKIQSTLI